MNASFARPTRQTPPLRSGDDIAALLHVRFQAQAMNAVEFVSCALVLASAVASSFLLGSRFGTWGYISGAPIGAGIWIGGIYILILGEDLFRKLPKRLPTCKNGRCRTRDYRTAPDSRERELVCACGDRYRLSGKTLFYIDSDRKISAYMRKGAFMHWSPVQATNRKGI